MFPNWKLLSLKSILSITAKLKTLFSVNKRLEGSALFIRVFSNLRSCLFVCPIIEHLVKRSCNEDNNFGRRHNEANTFGSHKFECENAKLTKDETSKERILLTFGESSFLNNLLFECCFRFDSIVLFFNINISIDSKKIIRGLGNAPI